MEAVGIEREGIVIDRCAACGWFWLDAGELAHVLAYAARRLRGRAPPADLERLLADPVAQARPASGTEGSPLASGLLVAEAVGWVLATLLGILG